MEVPKVLLIPAMIQMVYDQFESEIATPLNNQRTAHKPTLQPKLFFNLRTAFFRFVEQV